MLFVNFQSRSRARVNGAAEIIVNKDAYLKTWPLALRYVKVTVEQAYPNCNARIPIMTMAPLTDAFFDPVGRSKSPAYGHFKIPHLKRV
jgi:hypothetical protein